MNININYFVPSFLYMALKISVKISEVNNLTEARYCAGMGVEMIGFSMEESHPKYLPPAKIKEISNWITGMKIIGEFQNADAAKILAASDQLPMDYVQLQHPSADEFTQFGIPIILKINVSSDMAALENILKGNSQQVTLFLLESSTLKDFQGIEAQLVKFCSMYPILLGFGISKDSLEIVLETIKPAGIAFIGGEEIRPGLKDFEDLSEVLELLETED